MFNGVDLTHTIFHVIVYLCIVLTNNREAAINYSSSGVRNYSTFFCRISNPHEIHRSFFPLVVREIAWNNQYSFKVRETLLVHCTHTCSKVLILFFRAFPPAASTSSSLACRSFACLSAACRARSAAFAAFWADASSSSSRATSAALRRAFSSAVLTSLSSSSIVSRMDCSSSSALRLEDWRDEICPCSSATRSVASAPSFSAFLRARSDYWGERHRYFY